MEGTSLAGSGVSVAYLAKEIEHICMNGNSWSIFGEVN